MTLSILHHSLRKIDKSNVLPACLNVGLTGGMGSGKSTVSKLLSAKGVAIVDLDALAHGLTAESGAAMEMIARTFGEDVVLASGALNRDAMRALIFKDASAKAKLESIIHPMLLEVASAQAHVLAQARPVCIVYDIPLLAKSPMWQNLLDWIVVVSCPVDIRIERVKQRNPALTEVMIRKIIETQASDAEMQAIADVVINNSENDLGHLQLNSQINILFEYLEQHASSHQS